jgi:hypothetical protein
LHFVAISAIFCATVDYKETVFAMETNPQQETTRWLQLCPPQGQDEEMDWKRPLPTLSARKGLGTFKRSEKWRGISKSAFGPSGFTKTAAYCIRAGTAPIAGMIRATGFILK